MCAEAGDAAVCEIVTDCVPQQLTFFEKALFPTIRDAEVWQSMGRQAEAGEYDEQQPQGRNRPARMGLPPHDGYNPPRQHEQTTGVNTRRVLANEGDTRRTQPRPTSGGKWTTSRANQHLAPESPVTLKVILTAISPT